MNSSYLLFLGFKIKDPNLLKIKLMNKYPELRPLYNHSNSAFMNYVYPAFIPFEIFEPYIIIQEEYDAFGSGFKTIKNKQEITQELSTDTEFSVLEEYRNKVNDLVAKNKKFTEWAFSFLSVEEFDTIFEFGRYEYIGTLL